MNKIFGHIKNYMAVAVTVAVALVAFNSAVNGHYHITETGYVIWHAHPYSDSSNSTPYKNHTHSDYELTFLQLLTNLLNSALALAIAVIFVFTAIQFFFSAIYSQFESSRFSFNYSLRAPPIVVN